MKTILFPTDFSENARQAMHFAIDLARKAKAKIILVNAYDMPYSQNVMTTSLLDIMKESSEKGLEKLGQELAAGGVPFQIETRLGNPIRIVKQLTDEFEADLVVLGTKGATGLEEVLIGSNAASILHAVDVPVLAIPAEAKAAGMNKIVYATDFRPGLDTKPLAELRELAQLMGAEVQVLHVQDPDKQVAIDWSKYEKALEGVKHSMHVVKGRQIETEIHNFIEREGANAVALMEHRYGFFEKIFHSSMTSKVAFHARVPFISLTERA